MARVFPSDFDQELALGQHANEIATLRRLKRELPAEYTVFHGVHWSREKERFNAFGEIDFVVLNGRGGVLIIEQKNGALEVVNGNLYKRYPEVAKDVFAQVDRSIEAIRRKFESQAKLSGALDVDYLLFCPDHRVTGVLGSHLDRSRVIDATTSSSLARRIQELIPIDARSSPEPVVAALDRFFRQTFNIVADVHAHRALSDRSFTSLSGPQIELVTTLEMSPLRLRIKGAAGCGKTQIALHYLQRALDRGERPLLACFNRPLADKLKSAVQGSAMIDTWHGLINTFLRDRGRKIDFNAAESDPEFWRKFVDRAIEEEIPENWKFNPIIVDEGQDFEQDWWEVLKLFAREDTDMVWLEDQAQNLTFKKPVALPDFVSLTFSSSFRSPGSIAGFIERNLEVEFSTRNPSYGLGVGLHPIKTEDQQASVIAKIVSNLRRQKFALEDIVILTTRGIRSGGVNIPEKVGEYLLSRFEGYSEDGVPHFSEGQILLESVYRFKGQQAPAVILVDVDWDRSEKTPDMERKRRILFCGMTRATLRLDIVCSSRTTLTA